MNYSKLVISEFNRSTTDDVLNAIVEPYISNSADGNSKNGKIKNGDKYLYRFQTKRRKQRIKKARFVKAMFSVIQ